MAAEELYGPPGGYNSVYSATNSIILFYFIIKTLANDGIAARVLIIETDANKLAEHEEAAYYVHQYYDKRLSSGKGKRNNIIDPESLSYTDIKTYINTGKGYEYIIYANSNYIN